MWTYEPFFPSGPKAVARSQPASLMEQDIADSAALGSLSSRVMDSDALVVDPTTRVLEELP